MNMYDTIYEAICDKYEDGYITLEQAEELNDLAYDRYVTEMKSKAEYRERKFRNKYMTGDDTVIKINNKKYPILFTDGSKKYSTQIKASSANIRDEDLRNSLAKMYNVTPEEAKNLIIVNRSTFNQKYPKTHEFIIGHEIGHNKMRDLKKSNPTEYYNSRSKYMKDIMNNEDKLNDHASDPTEYTSDNFGIKMVGKNNAKKAFKDLSKNAQKHTNEEIKRVKTSSDPDIKNNKDAIINQLKKDNDSIQFELNFRNKMMNK